MNPKNKKLVVFDFDGVLANTEEFCYKLHKDVNKNLTWQKWQDFCNGNFIEGIENAVNEEAHMIPENFYEKYQNEIEKINVSDVIRKSIISLDLDYLIVIVSSTSSNTIKNFLTKDNLDSYFSDILGSDVHKDKSVKIDTLLEKYNIKPNNAVLITDSLGDILEGNNSGVNSIGVTWGIHDKKTLEKGKPIAIIDDPRDLLETIQNVLK